MQESKKTKEDQSVFESDVLSFGTMIRDFYNLKMLSWVVITWVYALVFVGVAIYSGIRFFDAVETKVQIMYAVLFVCSVQFICLIKLFAWQIIHRNGIIRAIKRLEEKMVK